LLVKVNPVPAVGAMKEGSVEVPTNTRPAAPEVTGEMAEVPLPTRTPYCVRAVVPVPPLETATGILRP